MGPFGVVEKSFSYCLYDSCQSVAIRLEEYLVGEALQDGLRHTRRSRYLV